MSGTNNFKCSLCGNSEAIFFHHDRLREYWRCQICRLVFVPPSYFLSAADEKAEYDRHQNNPNDPGYRKFLSRLFEPMNTHLPPESTGLDFGSGPGPTLSLMFTEAGHKTQIYDPFYAPDSSVFEQRYDFITATEVVEHLHAPADELNRLWNCLKPGGQLGIMTKLVLNQNAFARWHYIRDLTHVCFFSRETFKWLAAHWNTECVFPGNDVILLEK